MSLNFIKAWRNDKWYNKRVLIWCFTRSCITPLRLSDGTSEKIRDSQTCRYDEQIYFHWYKIPSLLYKRAQDKFKFGVKLISDNFYVSVPEWFLFLFFKYWYFRSLNRFWDSVVRRDKWKDQRFPNVPVRRSNLFPLVKNTGFVV
jgi:hypothetical protein